MGSWRAIAAVEQLPTTFDLVVAYAGIVGAPPLAQLTDGGVLAVHGVATEVLTAAGATLLDPPDSRFAHWGTIMRREPGRRYAMLIEGPAGA